jgi:hypothetical protein
VNSGTYPSFDCVYYEAPTTFVVLPSTFDFDEQIRVLVEDLLNSALVSSLRRLVALRLLGIILVIIIIAQISWSRHKLRRVIRRGMI